MGLQALSGLDFALFLNMKHLYAVVFLLCCTLPIVGQSVYAEFGKNRVQYHDDFDNWWMYETENFIIYWYGKGRNIGQTVVQMAELDNSEIQNALEFRFNDKIEIIVYVDLTDMHQSNIGIDEIFTSTAGTTKILGNKMFVYFNGDHQDLRHQIREGMASVYLESMLYGTNLQEIVQNAVLLNLPEWFKEGLSSYLGQPWSKHVDDRLRDLFQSSKKRHRNWKKISVDHPVIAGHSMWYYLAESYGRSSIANLLYLTRINRNLEDAFLYVLGITMDELEENWLQFFNQKYDQEVRDLISYNLSNEMDISNRRDREITELVLSPDGRYLAYVLNDIGKAKVYLHDLETDDRRMVLKTGMRNRLQKTETNYPLIAWSPDGSELSIIYEKRDVAYHAILEITSGMLVIDKLSPEYQRVYSMDYWSTDTLIFSASTEGLSDLFAYFPKTRESLQITDDYYDDLDVFVSHSIEGHKKHILFSSNRLHLKLQQERLDSLLPIDNFDIYMLDWEPDGESKLRNLTNSPKANDRQAKVIPEGSVVFLSDATGIWNRKLIEDPFGSSVQPKYVSNYNRNIRLHESNSSSDFLFQTTRTEMHNRLIKIPLLDVEGISPAVVTNPGERQDLIRLLPEPDDIKQVKGAEDITDPRYLFQSEFEGPVIDRPAQSRQDTQNIVTNEEEEEHTFDFLQLPETGQAVMYRPEDLVEFNFSRAIAYRLKFKLHDVQSTMDNSLLFTGLDNYAGMRQEFNTPPLGILLKAEIKDLFEDYVFEGGARFPTSFNGSEYFLLFSDRKKRIDKRYGFYRKTTVENAPDDALGRGKDQNVTVIGQVQLRYPLDIYTSIRATGTFRNDRLIHLATDQASLDSEIRDDQRAGLRLEYVYDNTLEKEINFLNGTRYKAWVEVVKKFDLNLFEEGETLTFNKGFMTVLGVDARHYQPLDKHSIFAARLFASTSFGSERIIYYLGGVENWLFSEYNNSIPVPQNINFAYQTIAAQMRGFKFNARNGASVALINTELRIPFLRYFSRTRIKSSFLRNFQAVGFFDVGTAWHGSDPFSDENPLNTLVLSNPPTVKVEVKYFRNPIILGYGAGVRTSILGYFVKLDYAWGYETKRIQDPILHLSIGTDF